LEDVKLELYLVHWKGLDIPLYCWHHLFRA